MDVLRRRTVMGSPVRGNPRSTRLGNDEAPKVLFVTSEISDFVKSGGLGEVSAALPRALRQTTDIRVLIPGYRQVTQERIILPVAHLPASAGVPACDLGRIDMRDGLILYVVLCPELYDRDGSPYGDADGCDWSDNDVRFARLSMAAADIAGGSCGLDWAPDLLHVNDWPSALTPGYLAWRGVTLPSILTIHNLAYQGIFGRDALPRLGIPEDAFKIDGVEFHGLLSYLKTGIFYASHVTTVSSTYAREIATPEFGCGLDGLLRTRAGEGRLTGILNGIDDSWEPRTDPTLSGNFDHTDLSGRHANASAVREIFQLGVSRGPLFAIVSRLVHQKGLDLVLEAADRLVAGGGQIAVVGQGDGQIESELVALAERHPNAVGVRVGFDEAEARRLYAGSDFLLMPSRFEPCGLSQMYAQRYGSLPIARQTGGLADTVEDGVTGFLFEEPTSQALMEGIGRAFETYASKARLQSMRRAAMRRPINWGDSARRYGDLYARELTGIR